jgi:hypothetical protein
MSGTPEFYFNNRWKGLEKLSEFIGDKKCSKNNSVDLSTSENIAEVVNVIEIFLTFSSDVKSALLDDKLTKEDLEIEIEALNARVKWAIEKLHEGSSLIEEELRSMKISYANVKAYEVWEKMEKEKKFNS